MFGHALWGYIHVSVRIFGIHAAFTLCANWKQSFGASVVGDLVHTQALNAVEVERGVVKQDPGAPLKQVSELVMCRIIHLRKQQQQHSG